jgi:hypothetical protein
LHAFRLGRLGLKEHGSLPTAGVQVLSATVSEQAGHWSVSVQVQVPQDHAAVMPVSTTTQSGPVVGVDLGLTDAGHRLGWHRRGHPPGICSGASRRSSGSTGW